MARRKSNKQVKAMIEQIRYGWVPLHIKDKNNYNDVILSSQEPLLGWGYKDKFIGTV